MWSAANRNMKKNDHAQSSLKRIFQIFLPMLWEYRKALFIAYLWSFIAVAAIILSPWPLKFVIDYVLIDKALPDWLTDLTLGLSPVAQVLLLALVLVLISAIGAFASATEKNRNAKIREQLDLDVRERLLNHIQSVPAILFDNQKSGELVLRLVDDGQKVVRLLTKTTPVIFRYLTTTLFAFVAMCMVSPFLGILGGLIVLMLSILVRRYAGPLQEASRFKRKTEGDVSALAQEIIKGLANTQAHGMEHEVSQRFQSKTRISKRAGVEETRVAVLMELSMQLANGLAVSLIIGGGGYLVLQDQLSLGSLTVCLAYMTQLLKPVEKINELAATVSRALVRGEYLIHLFDQFSPIPDRPNATHLLQPKGIIRLEDVGYAYSSRDNNQSHAVLQHVNLVLEPNKLIVLVGPSGSGKSTLLKLLLRMMDPTEGTLLFDGVPYQNIQLKHLRQQFAVMMQRNHVFSGTLRTHFFIPGQDIDDQKIWNALELVAMADYVKQLPQELDSPLKEDGLNLSGGQRARLDLARTFLLDRPVLLLDEPLANVDPESSQIIMGALDRIRVGRSCLVATHQMEMAKRADQVIQLKNGKLLVGGFA